MVSNLSPNEGTLDGRHYRVSARGGQQDKVAALNFGADDYMTKPFGIEELLARITATFDGPARPSRSKLPLFD